MTSVGVVENVVILGTGPAGLTAAIYAARANLKPLIVSGDQPGGQLTITSDVENYPGFPEGIMGPELMEHFKKQAERFGTRFLDGWVDEVDFSKAPFKMRLTSGEWVESKTVILATGASAKWLGLESETRLRGKGVSARATCDGFFFRNQDVVIVGGGDTAMEEATFLTRFAKTVTLIHRKDSFRASKIMVDKARNNPKIKIIFNSGIEEVLGEQAVTGVRIKNYVTNETQILNCQGVFIAIGHQPNTKVFTRFIKHDETGYLKVEPGTTKTNIPGIFAAGDLADHVYRQAITAAGSGCMAAIDAERYLESH